MPGVFHLVFYAPCIPGNTGAAIRLVACAGATLHLIEPLGFSLSDAHLRRAGLDYHDMARVHVHADLPAALDALGEARILAFTGHASTHHTALRYLPGDALLFGPEPTGLPAEVLDHPAVTQRVRIPMMPGVRSLNLANSASIALYEAWRQHAFAGGV